MATVALPPAPRPPTLPELTHADDEGSFEVTAGAILPNGSGPTTHAYVQRLGIEVPLRAHNLYVGGAYELAESSAPGASRIVSGNLQLEARALWATPTGLSFGGGTAVIVPTASFDSASPANAAALSAATLRPWDVSFFIPNAFGVRPFIDVRAIDGAFVAQFREGFDVLFSTTALADWNIYATTGLYLGFWLTPAVAFGAEAFEAYAIDVRGVRDGARASVVVSPNVRLALPWVQPAISAFTSVGTPLQGASANMWGFKVGATVALLPASL